MTNSIHRPSPTSVISSLLDTAVEVQHATRVYFVCENKAKGGESTPGIFQPSEETRANVWAYFGFYTEGTVGKSVCRKCRQENSTNHSFTVNAWLRE